MNLNNIFKTLYTYIEGIFCFLILITIAVSIFYPIAKLSYPEYSYFSYLKVAVGAPIFILLVCFILYLLCMEILVIKDKILHHFNTKKILKNQPEIGRLVTFIDYYGNKTDFIWQSTDQQIDLLLKLDGEYFYPELYNTKEISFAREHRHWENSLISSIKG